MAEEVNIPPGYCWVRSRKTGEWSIVLVTTTKFSTGIEWPVVLHHGCEVGDDIETAVQEFEFLCGIERPNFFGTVIDRTGPVPVARGMTDEEIRQIGAAKTPSEHDYNLDDLDDDGNLKESK